MRGWLRGSSAACAHGFVGSELVGLKVLGQRADAVRKGPTFIDERPTTILS